MLLKNIQTNIKGVEIMLLIINEKTNETKEAKEFSGNAEEAFKKYFQKDAKKALAAKINGELKDLTQTLPSDGTVEMILPESPDGLEILRHSTSHIMAAAVKKLFPEAKVAIGPSIDNGFYYDFDISRNFVPEDLPLIEKEMDRLIGSNLQFTRLTMPKAEAKAFFAERGEKYKLELIDAIPDETVGIYTSGDFTDLCMGPHIPSASKIKAFKLLSIAGAYWRGDEKNPMLQRIYGTAFNDKKELDEYIENLEEAKKRDHRKLGRDLDIFNFYDEGGPGLVYWHPNGGLIRKIIEDFWREEHLKRGYDLVYTPHIARIDLWKRSGHWDFYHENMYSPIDIDEQQYILKPMNCPFHILIYNSKPKSYKDLPVRTAELGTVYRYERSGALHGLLRVRGFTQDDGHIFCTPEQLEDEVKACVKFALYMIETLGFKEYEVNLATRPEKYAGTEEEWDKAEATLRHAVETLGLKYVTDEGGAVFYGPKIDVKMKDALGRLWQGPTVQFDFNLSRRFDVKYKGADGQEHHVFMVHRALFGSLERFMGNLIEHYGGAFPVWLMPIQVMMIPVSDKHASYCDEFADKLREQGIRVKVDSRNEKVNYKIREAQLDKIPYMLVAGDKEIENKTVSVRHRKDGDLGVMFFEDFLEKLKSDIRLKI